MGRKQRGGTTFPVGPRASRRRGEGPAWPAEGPSARGEEGAARWRRLWAKPGQARPSGEAWRRRERPGKRPTPPPSTCLTPSRRLPGRMPAWGGALQPVLVAALPNTRGRGAESAGGASSAAAASPLASAPSWLKPEVWRRGGEGSPFPLAGQERGRRRRGGRITQEGEEQQVADWGGGRSKASPVGPFSPPGAVFSLLQRLPSCGAVGQDPIFGVS